MKDEYLQVLLKPITKREGFCFDDVFLECVKTKIRSKKKRAILDKLLCAQIIAQFLALYQDQQISLASE